jgi:beta-glucanase (GH16 family)
MTKTPSFHALKRFLLLLICFSATLSFIPKAVAVPPPGYYLVWSDEFNSTSLDRSKWDYWLLGRRRNAINVTNAISLNGSNLVITTFTSNKVHYTGVVATDETFRPRYGYWESSLRWSDTSGMWSAFWLQSPEMISRLRDPQLSGSEIDIAEHRFLDKDTSNIANKIQVNLHWNGYGPGSHSSGSGNIASNLASGFHTYGFLWTPDSYSFLVDDSKVYGHGSAPISHSTAWVALSSEVDDTSTLWAGHIPADGYGGLTDSTTKMAVDYVRYYAPSNVLFWTGATSEYWGNASNWIAGKLPLPTSDLMFTYLSTNSITVIGQNYSIDGITILQTKENVFINGADTLRIGARGIDMSTANHQLEIAARVELTAPQTWLVGQKAGGLKVTDALAGKETLTKGGPGTLILESTDEFLGRLNVDAGVVSTGNSIRRLNFSGGITLSSNSGIALKINGELRAGDQLRIAGPIIYRGNLKISNVAGDLKAGDQFKLFEAESYSGDFEHVALPPISPGLEWNTRSLTNGILSVIITRQI